MTQADLLDSQNTTLRTEFERRILIAANTSNQVFEVDQQIEQAQKNANSFIKRGIIYIVAALILAGITVIVGSEEKQAIQNSTLFVLMLFMFPIANSFANSHHFNTVLKVLVIERMRYEYEWRNIGLVSETLDEIIKSKKYLVGTRAEENLKSLNNSVQAQLRNSLVARN